MSDDEADEEKIKCKSDSSLEECHSNIDSNHDTGFSISNGNAL